MKQLTFFNRLFILLSFLIIANIITAQNPNQRNRLKEKSVEIISCGTEASQSNISYMSNLNQLHQPTENDFLNNFNSSNKNVVMHVPIVAHILRTTSGAGGLSITELNDEIVKLNNFFINSNIEFFLCNDGIKYIDNSTYYDFDSQDDVVIGADNDVINVINIYFANSLSSGGTVFCGYTNFPGGPNRIFMSNACTGLGANTIVHEMGHFYGLYHAHGKTNFGTTDELVNGSNCTNFGDDICDTPADPNLSGLVSFGCNYTGTAVDANNDFYIPDPTNIMSYSRHSCRNFFSPGQYARMNSVAINSIYRTNYQCPAPCSSLNTSIYHRDTLCITSGSFIQLGGTPTASGGNPPYSYQWSSSPTININSANANPFASIYSNGYISLTVTDIAGCVIKDSIVVDTSCAIICDSNLTAIASYQDTICFSSGGSMFFGSGAPVSGGSAPYSYLWSGFGDVYYTDTLANYTTVLSVSGGSVVLTVTDAFGCTDKDTVVLDISCANPCSPIITASAYSQDTICFSSGGSIQVFGHPIATSGSNPYTYNWSSFGDVYYSDPNIANTNIFSTFGGEMILTVIGDSGCFSMDTVNIDISCATPCSSLNIEAYPQDTLCLNVGDSIQVGGNPTASGGTPPYTYQWFGGNFSNNTIANPIFLRDNIFNHEINLFVTDANGCFVYDTLYFDINCITSPCSSLNIEAYPQDTICLNVGDSIQVGGNPTASGGTPPYTYQWWASSANASFNDATISNPIVTVQSSGDIKLEVIDANGCSTLDTIEFDANCTITSIGNDLLKTPIEEVKIYPNPVKNNLTIVLNLREQSQTKIIVTDLIGNVVALIANNELNVGVNKIYWNTSNIANGVYLLSVTTAHSIQTKKLIINR